MQFSVSVTRKIILIIPFLIFRQQLQDMFLISYVYMVNLVLHIMLNEVEFFTEIIHHFLQMLAKLC